MFGHVKHFCNSGTPNNSGTVKARNFQFGTVSGNVKGKTR